MSNFSVAEDTPAHTYEMRASDETIPAPVTPQIHVKSWHIDILMIVMGLLALFFFIAMGGVFALLGPWVIYMGVLSIRKSLGLGQQILRIITGVALLFLSVAVLLASAPNGPWCIVGALLGLLVGSSYIANVFFTRRNILR